MREVVYKHNANLSNLSLVPSSLALCFGAESVRRKFAAKLKGENMGIACILYHCGPINRSLEGEEAPTWLI